LSTPEGTAAPRLESEPSTAALLALRLTSLAVCVRLLDAYCTGLAGCPELPL